MSFAFAGMTPKTLLVGEDLFAQGIPAHVELALELVDTLLLGVVRRVGSAGRVVDKERRVVRRRIKLLQ